jgi:hypothetical protein
MVRESGVRLRYISFSLFVCIYVCVRAQPARSCERLCVCARARVCVSCTLKVLSPTT